MAGVRACYSLTVFTSEKIDFESCTERACLNPAAPLLQKRGITFIFPENGGMINSSLKTLLLLQRLAFLKESVAAFISALPGGNRNTNGNFNNQGNNGNWWSSNENSTNNAWNRKLNYNNDKSNRNNNNKDYGFSVRCLRDLETVCSAWRSLSAMLYSYAT